VVAEAELVTEVVAGFATVAEVETEAGTGAGMEAGQVLASAMVVVPALEAVLGTGPAKLAVKKVAVVAIGLVCPDLCAPQLLQQASEERAEH